MKKWIRNSVRLFVLIALIFAFDQLMEFGLKRNNNWKASYISRGEINADILFHGPCEVIWTIDPEIIEKETGKKVYNLSEVHTDFADNYLSLYLYLKHNKSPEKLLLFVTPESMDERYNVFYPHYYTMFRKDSIVSKVMNDCDSSFSRFADIPLIRYTYHNRITLFGAIQGIKHELQGKVDPYFKNGYVPPKEMIWDNHYEELYKLYPNGVTFKWSPKREKYLKKIIELCELKGIELILYESPILLESTVHQYNRSDVMNSIHSVAKEHHLSYWVYDQDSLCLDRSNFFSALNLNIDAGKEFSKKIGERLR